MHNSQTITRKHIHGFCDNNFILYVTTSNIHQHSRGLRGIIQRVKYLWNFFEISLKFLYLLSLFVVPTIPAFHPYHVDFLRSHRPRSSASLVPFLKIFCWSFFVFVCLRVRIVERAAARPRSLPFPGEDERGIRRREPTWKRRWSEVIDLRTDVAGKRWHSQWWLATVDVLATAAWLDDVAELDKAALDEGYASNNAVKAQTRQRSLIARCGGDVETEKLSTEREQRQKSEQDEISCV